MLIFGRDPAVILSLVGTAIQLFAAFVIDLSIEQQAACNAIFAAAIGLFIALCVKDGQVAAVLGFAQALIALAIGFGLRLDPDNQAVIMSFVGTAAGMFIRTQVTAPVPPPSHVGV